MNHFCVIWKLDRKIDLLDAVDQIENNFQQEETQINNNKVKQVVEYIFPISYEINCLYSVIAFDLEICNFENSEYCVSYAAGVYHPSKLHECFNGDINKEELVIERSKVHVFD